MFFLHNPRYRFFDKALIVSTLLTLFSLPIMLFNPMNQNFHHMQATDVFFVVSAFFFGVNFFKSTDFFMPKPGHVACAVVIFIIVLAISAFKGLSPTHSVLGIIKIAYLFALSALIYAVGVNYQLQKTYGFIFAASFIVVIMAGVLGGVLLYFNVPSFFASQTRIIPLALGIQNWVSFIPRINSVLLPTANMLGAYLACASLPVFCFLYLYGEQPKTKRVLQCLLGLVIFLGLLTMSRTFVGVLLAAYFILGLVPMLLPLQKIWRAIFLMLAILVWAILLFYSVLYPVQMKFQYETDLTFQKPIVTLKTGDSRPNPVYFLRKDRGLETVKLSLSYGINHYAWLKYGAIKLGLMHLPWGIGINNYSLGMQNLIKEQVVAEPLRAYLFAQSQYFTAFAEFGLLGSVAFLAIFIVLLIKFLKQYYARQDILCLAMFITLWIVSFIAIDLDVIYFRWLWGMMAMGLLQCHKPDLLGKK